MVRMCHWAARKGCRVHLDPDLHVLHHCNVTCYRSCWSGLPAPAFKQELRRPNSMRSTSQRFPPGEMKLYLHGSSGGEPIVRGFVEAAVVVVVVLAAAEAVVAVAAGLVVLVGGGVGVLTVAEAAGIVVMLTIQAISMLNLPHRGCFFWGGGGEPRRPSLWHRM